MSKWKVESNFIPSKSCYLIRMFITNEYLDIYEKDLIAILHLLVAIIRHFRVPIELPENVTVRVIIIQVKFGFYFLLFIRDISLHEF